MRRPEHADAAWCSLSIHHLSTHDKLGLMKAIRGATGARGIFLLYEPTRRADEDRTAWLDRFARTNKPLWTRIDATRMGPDLASRRHLRLSRDRSRWCDLGREAGFRRSAASLRRSYRLLPAVPFRSIARATLPRMRENRGIRTHGLESARDLDQAPRRFECARRWASRGPIKSDQPRIELSDRMVYVEVNSHGTPTAGITLL